METEKNIEIPFTIPFTVYYALSQPKAGTKDYPLLLTIHGWGQKCKNFIRDFSPLRDAGIFVVAPQGPHQFYVDAATKKVGCNWLTAYQRDQSIQDTNTYFALLVEKIKEDYPVDSQRIYLMGFSQGVSMAYRFAVSGLIKPAGLIACGADIAPDVVAKLPTCAPFPILLAQGKEDTLIPEMVLDTNQTLLRDAHYPFEVFRYNGGHEITQELCDKIGEWIAAR